MIFQTILYTALSSLAYEKNRKREISFKQRVSFFGCRVADRFEFFSRHVFDISIPII